MSKHSTVMIIDDSEMDTFLNKVILETMHYSDTILTYTNPSNALAYFKGLVDQPEVPGKIPEIVFLDINMPIMNGFEFMEEFIKLPENLTSRVKFYMISSSEDPEDLEKIKSYDKIIKYLYKPLDKNQLI